MRPVPYLKNQIRRSLRKAGLQLRKHPAVEYSPAPIFDMAVELLMSKRGTQLTFIQVGANDGKYVDPLRRYVVELPWTGVLVEPQPDVFRRLLVNYEAQAHRLHFENVAISGESASISMFRAPTSPEGQGVHASSVASFNRAVTARQLGLAPSALEEIVVPCSTLDALVAKYELGTLDLLQVDVEGAEWVVLSTLDLRKTRPALIQFEHGHMTRAAINRAVEYLTRNEYRLHYGGYESDSLAIRSDLFGR